MTSKPPNCEKTVSRTACEDIVGHTACEIRRPPRNFRELHAQAPNVILCFKRARERTNGNGPNCDASSRTTRSEKRAKSRELRASILYVGCDCEKRNGLQDQCPRSECQGQPQCLTNPPTCPPSEFAGGKHLERKRELFLQRKKEAERARAAKAAQEELEACRARERAAKQRRGRKEKLHYDCIAIDKLLEETDECPICCKPLDYEEVCYKKPILNDEFLEPFLNEDACGEYETQAC